MGNTKKISTEEKWMQIYFEQLKEERLIKEIIYQPEPIILSNRVVVPIHKQLKTKVKIINKPILIEREYTMDFIIIWNTRNIFHKSISDDYYEEKLPLFFSNMNESYIEVKSNSRFDHNMKRFFLSRTQPIVWDKFNIYINLIEVPNIFKNTFIPDKILHEFYYRKRTKKNNVGDKKYNFEYRTLKEFLNE